MESAERSEQLSETGTELTNFLFIVLQHRVEAAERFPYVVADCSKYFAKHLLQDSGSLYKGTQPIQDVVPAVDKALPAICDPLEHAFDFRAATNEVDEHLCGLFGKACERGEERSPAEFDEWSPHLGHPHTECVDHVGERFFERLQEFLTEVGKVLLDDRCGSFESADQCSTDSVPLAGNAPRFSQCPTIDGLNQLRFRFDTLEGFLHGLAHFLGYVLDRSHGLLVILDSSDQFASLCHASFEVTCGSKVHQTPQHASRLSSPFRIPGDGSKGCVKVRCPSGNHALVAV